MQENRKDLSHPVHSDNCILDEATGECNKIPPAYTWRDYRYMSKLYIQLELTVHITAPLLISLLSAILYLNNEFEGGQFFFAHSTKDLSPEVMHEENRSYCRLEKINNLHCEPAFQSNTFSA